MGASAPTSFGRWHSTYTGHKATRRSRSYSPSTIKHTANRAAQPAPTGRRQRSPCTQIRDYLWPCNGVYTHNPHDGRHNSGTHQRHEPHRQDPKPVRGLPRSTTTSPHRKPRCNASEGGGAGSELGVGLPSNRVAYPTQATRHDATPHRDSSSRAFNLLDELSGLFRRPGKKLRAAS